MTDNIPAWKRAGLKVTSRAAATQQVLASTSKRKTLTDESILGEKMPPKRVKLPKNERPPPPEADQLVYMRQYSEDKANWKFSKQKQNWILKHIYTIDKKYDGPLDHYLSGIQGGSRQRIADEARVLVEKWNTFMSEKETDQQEDGQDHDFTTDVNENVDEKQNAQPSDKKQRKSAEKKEVPPQEAAVLRAQRIVKLLTGEEIKAVLLDDDAGPKADESLNSSKENEIESKPVTAGDYVTVEKDVQSEENDVMAERKANEEDKKENEARRHERDKTAKDKKDKKDKKNKKDEKDKNKKDEKDKKNGDKKEKKDKKGKMEKKEKAKN
jgi:hypothetical protein